MRRVATRSGAPGADEAARILSAFVDAHGASDGSMCILDEDGAAAHPYAWMAKGALASFMRGPAHTMRLGERIPMAHSMRTRMPVFLANADQAVREFPILAGPVQQMPPSRHAVLPLVAGGSPIGTVACVWEGSRGFTARERTELQAAADRVAQAMADATAAARRERDGLWAARVAEARWADGVTEAALALLADLADQVDLYPVRAGAVVGGGEAPAPPAAQRARLVPLFLPHATPDVDVAADEADLERLEAAGAHSIAFLPMLDGGRCVAVVRVVRHRTQACLDVRERDQAEGWSKAVAAALRDQKPPLRRGGLFGGL